MHTSEYNSRALESNGHDGLARETNELEDAGKYSTIVLTVTIKTVSLDNPLKNEIVGWNDEQVIPLKVGIPEASALDGIDPDPNGDPIVPNKTPRLY